MYPSDGICPDCRTRVINGMCDCADDMRAEAEDFAAAEQAAEDAHDEDVAGRRTDSEPTRQATREAA